MTDDPADLDDRVPNGIPTGDPAGAWRWVIAVLIEAAERGYAESAQNPAVHSVSLGADLLASQAIALTPPGDDVLLDAVDLGPQVAALSVGGMIRAAEQSLRRFGIEQLPVGASGVIVGLGGLVAEAGP